MSGRIEVKVIRLSDIGRCPKQSMSPRHFRADGTCLCDEREAADEAVAAAEAKVHEARRELDTARAWRSRT